MAETKKYTQAQMANAEELAKILCNLPEEKRSAVTMMANAFIAGMEAQAQIASTEKAAV